MAILLSVCIPTRNRQRYALVATRSILAVGGDVQVVISDNSEDASLGAMLSSEIESGVVAYRHHPVRLSISENFDAVLSMCQGRYVTIIGDDDTVETQVPEITQWAANNDVEAVTMRQKNRVLHYFWPGSSSPRWGLRLDSALFLSDFTGRSRVLTCRETIEEAVACMGTGPRRLPKLYLGIVSRNLIDRVRSKYGRIFGSISPDIYSGVLLALEASRHVEIDYPFLLPGACVESNSIAHVRKPTEALETARNIDGATLEAWDERVPKFYSPETVWGRALIDVAVDSGLEIPVEGFASLYAACLVKAPRRYREIKTAAEACAREYGTGRITAAIAIKAANLVWSRTVATARTAAAWTPGGARYEYRDIVSADAARLKLKEHLVANRVQLKLTAPTN